MSRGWDAQGRMVMRASSPVAKGAALTIMYGNLTDVEYEWRQEALMAGHAFACRCERCVEEAAGERPEGMYTMD